MGTCSVHIPLHVYHEHVHIPLLVYSKHVAFCLIVSREYYSRDPRGDDGRHFRCPWKHRVRSRGGCRTYPLQGKSMISICVCVCAT